MASATNIGLDYLAGFIDGDGAFSINYSARCGYCSVITISSAKRVILDSIQLAYGGYLRVHKYGGTKPYLGHDLRIFPDSSGGILNELIGRLVVKTRQARICLELCHRKQGTMRRALSAEEIRARYQLKATVTMLNDSRCCPHFGVALPSIEYLAGFFDAEGCVCIGKESYSESRAVKVSVGNRCRMALAAYQERFGGSIHTVNEKFRVWQTSRRIAQKALEAMRPYLRLKAGAADNSLRLFALDDGRQHRGFTVAQLAEIAEIETRNHQLNARFGYAG